MSLETPFSHTLQKVRQLFPCDAQEDAEIARIFALILAKINSTSKGTIFGEKKQVDYQKIVENSKFPEKMQDFDQVISEITSLFEGTINRISPLTQENVVPPPTKLSIVAGALAEKFNENSIWDYYGQGAAMAEVKVTAMMSELVGYDHTKSSGVFTFGGTGCNLYGARIGIEKADPNAKETGIRDRIIFFCSDTSHYSIRSCAIWTGIGTDNLRVIRTDDKNSLMVEELEAAIIKEKEKGHRIGTIFCTMGTTDAFGIDPIDKIIKVRDQIQAELDYRIHIHADAVIGWPYLTFKGDQETLSHLSPRLAEEITRIISEITTIKNADSIGIDFHKTGWSPYLCSLFLVKNYQDLRLLLKSKKDMPYLYHGKGYQPGFYTLESSRPNYALKALVNILSLGREGYEALLVQLLTCADHLRDLIDKSPDIVVLNKYNPAFVTDFRIYPVAILEKIKNNGIDKNSILSKEMNDDLSIDFIDINQVNLYNRSIVEVMTTNAEKEGKSLVSYTDMYRTTNQGKEILAIKSYPMSPFIEKYHMEQLIKDIYQAKSIVDAQFFSSS
jgi:glutamate/tyrosine decarboxylase-like PLP-dependent enzyme